MRADAIVQCAAVAALACFPLAAADVEAEEARTGGKGRSHWHVGPFFEYRRADPGPATYWAVRPFYSQVRDPATRTVTRDVLWPLGAYHYHNDASWYRALIAYGDARDSDPSWSFNVFPLWFCGKDRTGDGYWGAFPLYGEHPHFLFMDDWQFFLWPIWQTYTVKDVRSHGVLWPFVTWRDAPRPGVGVWPIWGTARQRESEHGYCLWPLATWASYDEDRDTSGAGWSWMGWPLYGQIRRARESQDLLLPPFFSYARTDSATRWRLPWPLVEVLCSTTRDRISIWPFWESVHGYPYVSGKERKPEERTWRVGWQLMESTTLTTDRTQEDRFNFFPFWTHETRSSQTKDGVRKEVASYTRLWPFWSCETKKGLSYHRVLELIPIRHVEGIDRNWSPFWTFWECRDRPDGRTRHSIFWNFITWHTGESKPQGAPAQERNSK